jgi:hypothetical protein
MSIKQTSSSSLNIHTRQKQECMTMISVDDFKQFMCSRAYDIISEGRYRQYLVGGRASSEEWAINMQESVTSVLGATKRILESIKLLEDELGSCALSNVCREVSFFRFCSSSSRCHLTKKNLN